MTLSRPDELQIDGLQILRLAEARRVIQRMTCGLQLARAPAPLFRRCPDSAEKFVGANLGRTRAGQQNPPGSETTKPQPRQPAIGANRPCSFLLPLGQRWRVQDNQVKPAFV